ncbi:MAG: T9SS type A sorting domain-containing protein [Flavobacterium sp.]|nr:T9SS type A sorting domain-containing protein [Flavobacterium sp.]
MKTIFRILVFLFLAHSVQAQIVNIPDANFKNTLLFADIDNEIAKDINNSSIKIDNNNDGEIQLAEAQNVFYLQLSNNEIQNIIGIESFTFLINLDCAGSGISSFDFSMPSLQTLNCSGCPLLTSSLVLSGVQNLQTLDCSDCNLLISLDLSSLSNLVNFNCYHCDALTTLNLNGLSNLQNINCGTCGLLTSLSLVGLTNLQSLNCTDCYNMTSLNFGGNTSLTYLNCSNCYDLVSLDVNSLVNLQTLSCNYCISLTAINLSGMSNLNSISISNCSAVTNLNITGVNPIEFGCSAIGLSSIDVTAMTNLERLYLGYNALSNLNVSTLVNLKTLDFQYNGLNNIDLSQLINLEVLFCHRNHLTSLNINSLINLKYVDCHFNNLNTLDVSGLVNLQELYCSNNSMSSLNLTNCIQLYKLNIVNNNFSSIDLSDLVNLNSFECNENQITSLDFSNHHKLQTLNVNNNLLTSLDLSQSLIYEAVDYFIHNNPNLVYVNLKNGLNIANFGSIISTSGCPNLEFICADEEEVQYIQQLVSNPNVQVSSYCSFTPGGNYNTITGTTTFDSDNNGCDVADLPKPNIKVNINDGTNQGATFTNNSGDYNFYTLAGSYTLTPNIENPSWFTFSPTTATIPFANNNNNVVTQNFCISSNGIHNDLEVVIAPITSAQPGFDAVYQIVYKNKGNQTLSGDVSLTFDDNKTDFVSATPNPDNLAVNSLSWNYTNLLPFESRTINVMLNVNAPTDTPPVNIGDELDFVVAINPIVNDEIPLDNSFNYNQIVVGSFDPNNIECLEGEVVAPSYIGQYLHYAVNFENTGNFPAENIVVKIVIDTTKYDMNSLQLLNVSHNSYTRIKDNIVEIIFQQINLDSGGHGNILFKIRTNDNLVEGNSVAKRADIFFDYNAPIDTGMANTTFEVLNNSVFELDDTISIYPNPTSSIININGNFNIKTIQLYDVQGRLLQTQLADEVQTSIDISEKSKGVYFLKITSDKGSKVEKLIKE